MLAGFLVGNIFLVIDENIFLFDQQMLASYIRSYSKKKVIYKLNAR